MAITASFVPGTGVLTATGDGLDNAITASRDAAGNILVNGGGVPILGGTPTVANTSLILTFGQGGNDGSRSTKPTARCRPRSCSAAMATIRSSAGRAATSSSARPAMTPYSAKAAPSLSTEVTATTF